MLEFGLLVALILISAHYVADFVCQTQNESVQKSVDVTPLFTHVLKYSVIMTAVFCGMIRDAAWLYVTPAFMFFILTFSTHFGIDYASSRITRKLRDKNDMRKFFLVLGLDQWLHVAQLFLTYRLVVLL